MLQHTATGRVLIFTRTKRRARFLAQDLDNRGYRVSALQGNMAQNRRQAAINGFRDGKFDILVATDIAARGIDVTEISHVINYDMPDTVDAYTHRIGRTGRAHQTGEAFTFSVDDDAPMVREIEQVLGMQIERRQMDDFDYAGYVPSQAQSRPGHRRSRAVRIDRAADAGRRPMGTTATAASRSRARMGPPAAPAAARVAGPRRRAAAVPSRRAGVVFPSARVPHRATRERDAGKARMREISKIEDELYDRGEMQMHLASVVLCGEYRKICHQFIALTEGCPPQPRFACRRETSKPRTSAVSPPQAVCPGPCVAVQ